VATSDGGSQRWWQPAAADHVKKMRRGAQQDAIALEAKAVP